MPSALPTLRRSRAAVTVAWRNSRRKRKWRNARLHKLVPLQQNEASSDSGCGTTVAKVEACQHWQHSGAAQQAVAPTATQASEGQEARRSSGDCIIVSNTVVQCIDWLQQPRWMTAETKSKQQSTSDSKRRHDNIGNSGAQRIDYASAQHSKQWQYLPWSRWIEWGEDSGGVSRGRTVEGCRHKQHYWAAQQVATAKENKFIYNNHPIAHTVARGKPAAMPSGNWLFLCKQQSTISKMQHCRQHQLVVPCDRVSADRGGTSGIKNSKSNLNHCQQAAMKPFGTKLGP